MKKILIIIVAITIGIYLFVIQPTLSQGYCNIYPHIGTKYLSVEFTRSKFQTIRIGYTKKQVEEILGVTNNITSYKNGISIDGTSVHKAIYFAFYSTQRNGICGMYAFELFGIYYDKNFTVVGKQNSWSYE